MEKKMNYGFDFIKIVEVNLFQNKMKPNFKFSQVVWK